MDIALPAEGGRSARYHLVGQPVRPVAGAPFSRVAYAAAHVVADPLAMVDPWSRPVVDWERTMAFRRHLWRLGFSIAEAMDTSQRGMGFDWTSARELIRRSIAEPAEKSHRPHHADQAEQRKRPPPVHQAEHRRHQ